MKVCLELFLVVGIISLGHAQSSKNGKNIIGFACYYEGAESKSVQKVSQLIRKSKFKAIIRLLDSRVAAEKYLAVIVTEKLIAMDKLSASNKLNNKILEIYNSNEQVDSCDGCTSSDRLTLNAALNKENGIRIAAKYWIENHFQNQ